MTKTKITKRALLTSIMATLLCFTMLLGTTYAWFTDSVTSATNKIVAGNLDVVLYHTDKAATDEEVDSDTKLFDDVTLWEPGAIVWEKLTVKNNGSLALKYVLSINVTDISSVNGKSLADVLKVAVMTEQPTRDNVPVAATQSLETFNLASDKALMSNNSDEFYVAIYWAPSANDNDYNVADEALYANLGVTLLATQYTRESDGFDDQYDKDSEYPVINNTWNGTDDISWFLENPNATEFTLSTAEALAGLANLVDGSASIPADVASEITLPVTFEGKTVKLDADVDLFAVDENGERVSFDPIGYGYNTVFKGTFDGQGNTISNLYQNGWALGLDYSTEGGGLFASVVDATIKNINIDNAEIVMECIDMGILVGYSYGNCTYENITVSNSMIANYQRYTGGVVGEVNGTQTFKNVDVKDTVVSSLWGDFDCSLGGIVGGKYGDAKLTFEDCDVACELNTYNDVTSSYQWYAYRRAGMLIGNSEESATVDGRTSASASYLTCQNCTVTYGDWANYTYCEFAGTSWPYVRVQAGYSSDAYSNPRYGVATDANGNKAVDDTHVHNEGEDHNILLIFDQLYGGGQGVYGTPTHEGVTVIYNNK